MADAPGAAPADAGSAPPARSGRRSGLGVGDSDAFALASPRASLASLIDDDAAVRDAEAAAELEAALAAAQADAALAQSRQTALDLEARPARAHTQQAQAARPRMYRESTRVHCSVSCAGCCTPSHALMSAALTRPAAAQIRELTAQRDALAAHDAAAARREQLQALQAEARPAARSATYRTARVCPLLHCFQRCFALNC